jgi:hypothetical protein
MEQEIRDYLGVPGHVLEIKMESISVKDATAEIGKILSKYEDLGATKISDIPEGEDRKRLELLWNELSKLQKSAQETKG